MSNETMTNKEASEILKNMLNNWVVARENGKSETVMKICESFMKAIILLENNIDEEEDKSSLELWGENEVKLACQKENSEYSKACYHSALKAFKILCKDIGFTKVILNRLINGKPLTPIEDTEDIWNRYNDYGENHNYIEYQCKRMYSLFKKVYPDGSIEYSNVDQCYCKDIYTGTIYTSGLEGCIIRNMYPIKMPYVPGERIEVTTEKFLTYRKNGDFDTKGILSAFVDGEEIEINRYFAEAQDYPNIEEYSPCRGWVEITKEEFENRRAKADILRVQMKKENCEKSCQLYNVCQKKEEYQNNRTYCDDFVHVNYKPTEEVK